MPIFWNPITRVVIAITLITNIAWGESKKAATRGADKKSTKKRRMPRIAETVQAVSRYVSTFSFFWIRAVWKPVWEKVSRVYIANIAIPSSPKSSGERSLARIIVLTNPKLLFMILKAKTHKPPFTTLFERGSGSFACSATIASLLLGVSEIIHLITVKYLGALISLPY
jgi:hypothetical protein